VIARLSFLTHLDTRESLPGAFSWVGVSRMVSGPPIDWIPDLVAECWRELQHGSLWRVAYNDLRFLSRGDSEILGQKGIEWRDLARDSRGLTPQPLKDVFVDCQKMRDESRRATDLFRLLVALDRAAAGLRPTNATYHPDIRELVKRWKDKGNLAADSTLMVLPRAANGFRGGATLNQCLENYVVLDRGDYDVQFHHLDEHGDFSGLRASSIRVAFVPVLENDSDARFVPGRNGIGFSVALDHQRQAQLAGDMDGLVEKMENDGVNIALLPENCAATDVLEALRSALHNNFARRARRPSLRLLIVGVGSNGSPEIGRVFNDVCVLSGEGKLICRQTKLHPWHLDSLQVQRYGLTAKEVSAVEDIELEKPPTLHLLEDPLLGRLLILICEDFARIDTARDFAVRIGPSLVIGPVMDDSLEERSWAFSAANNLARSEPGALVLVANSCWLSRLAGPRGRLNNSARKKERGPGVGLVHDGRAATIFRFSPSGERRFVSRNVDVTRALAPMRRM